MLNTNELMGKLAQAKEGADSLAKSKFNIITDQYSSIEREEFKKRMKNHYAGEFKNAQALRAANKRDWVDEDEEE